MQEALYLVLGGLLKTMLLARMEVVPYLLLSKENACRHYRREVGAAG